MYVDILRRLRDTVRR